MTKRELEGQLRRVHPYRARSRRRRHALARTKHRMHAVLGIIFGIGLVALLGAVHLATQDRATVAGGLNAAWGRSHSRSLDGESYASDHASLIPKRKHTYNPFYDPRSRRAAKVRRAMLER